MDEICNRLFETPCFGFEETLPTERKKVCSMEAWAFWREVFSSINCGTEQKLICNSKEGNGSCILHQISWPNDFTDFNIYYVVLM